MSDVLEIREIIQLTSHTGTLNLRGNEMRKEVAVSNLCPIILQRLHLEIYNGVGW